MAFRKLILDCIFYSNRIESRAFFSKFWSYSNDAQIFSVLNNSFQSRMVYVFLKILQLEF